MKNILFGFFLLILGAVHAQTMKGDWMLGGSASFDVYKTRNYRYIDIVFNPNVGFFIVNNLALGATVNVGMSGSLKFYGLGAFGRYYIINIGKNAKILAQGTAGLEEYIGGFKSNIYSGGTGVAFFLNTHVALEGIMSYSNRTYKSEPHSYNNFEIIFGFQAHL